MIRWFGEIKAKIRRYKGWFMAAWLIAIVIALIAYGVNKRGSIEAGDVMQIMILLALVVVTGAYAWSASRQAGASAKMAKEMEEERIMASRPIIIERAVKEQRGVYFSNFEIYNAGNGPAIELTIAVVTEEKDSYIEARRATFMRAGDTPIEFHPFNISAVLEEKKTYYFACEYQGILSRVGKETWYQTWLPFKVDKASKEGEVYVTAGKLDFKEVTEKDRIDNLIRWSKPS